MVEENHEGDTDDILAMIRSGKLPPFPQEVGYHFKALGFDSYAAYLDSKLWKKIRRRVMKRDSKICKRCGGPATSVHHLRYTLEVLKGAADELLVCVCNGCHAFIEQDDGGRPRTDEEKDQALHEHDPSAFPAPFVGHPAPRRFEVWYPKEWRRMSRPQRDGWFKAAIKLGKTICSRP